MKHDLFTAFSLMAGQPDSMHQWVRRYTEPTDPNLHQFVLFLKPEATAAHAGVLVEAVLDTVLERLAAFDVQIGAARILAGPYLAAHALMDQHYGVINRISKSGESALTDAARANLHQRFAAELAAGAKVLGGHQFLAEHPDFSALALTTLNDNLGTTKLGGGSYVMKLTVLGTPFLLLNPFHAYQLVPFTTPGHCIIVLEGLSRRPWAELRGKLTGATDPGKAAPGSIRHAFLTRREALGLGDVTQGTNGVHLSAGPLEGMVEVQRFFTDHDQGRPLPYRATAFGALLASRGMSDDRISALAANAPLRVNDAVVSAFDLTEERDAADAAASLEAAS